MSPRRRDGGAWCGRDFGGIVGGMNTPALADQRATQSKAAGAGRAAVPAISIAGITKQFGSVEAVRDIDLQIEQGEIVAFLGPNGAGKTTTIDMLLGLSRPTAGSVEVLGIRPRQAIARG